MRFLTCLLNKIEIVNLQARENAFNLDKIRKFRKNGQVTIRIKLDNSEKIGQFGQNWTIWTKLDNSDKTGQFLSFKILVMIKIKLGQNRQNWSNGQD